MSNPSELLGKRAHDKITGIDGTIVSAEYNTYSMYPEVKLLRDGVNNNGDPWEPLWVPLHRVIIKKGDL